MLNALHIDRPNPGDEQRSLGRGAIPAGLRLLDAVFLTSVGCVRSRSDPDRFLLKKWSEELA